MPDEALADPTDRAPQLRIPEPPPHAAAIPSIAPGTTAKVNVSYQTEAVPRNQDPRIRQYPGMQRPINAVIAPRFDESLRRFNEYAADVVNIGHYRVYLERMQPKTFKTAHGHVAVPCGQLGEVALDEFVNIRDGIEDLHGGGSYRLIVQDGAGFNKMFMDFKIPIETCPPKINGEVVGTATPKNGNGSSASDPTGSGDPSIARELSQLRLEREKKNHEIALRRLDAEVEDDKARREDMARARMESISGAKSNPAVEVMKAQMEGLQKQIEASNQRMEKMMEQSNARFEKLMEANSAARPDTMKEMFAALSTILPAVLTSRAGHEDAASKAIVEAAKMNMEAQKENTRIAADANKEIMKTFMEVQREKKDPKDDDFKRQLLQTLLENKLTAPQDTMKTYLDAMNSGRDQAMQMLEWAENSGGRGGGEIDPESPGLSLINMLVDMFKKRPGQAPAPGLQPAGAYNEQQLRQIATQVVAPIVRAEIQRMVAPSAAGQLPNQAPAAGMRSLDNKFEIEGPPLVTPIVSPPSADMLVAGYPAPAVGVPTLSLLSNPQPIQTAASVPITVAPLAMPQDNRVDAVTGEIPEERLRFHLNEVLRIMIADLADGRVDHEWPVYAGSKLNKEFLDSLVQCADHAARLSLVQQYSDPELYGQVQSLIVSKPGGYQALIAGLEGLVQDHIDRKLGS